MNVPFNKPLIFGKELENIREALENRWLSGDHEFTKKCNRLMEERFKAKKVLLTTSGTHALELASLLIGFGRGDEVLCPSYTFVSTVNAIILQGAFPVFVDIREDTLNMDEELLEAAITDSTKAIYPVHYAGVGCEMDKIKRIAKEHDLFIVEDAAQGVNATYKNKYLGTIGDFGIYSFHETKNYTSGEGGAILINDDRFIERGEILREKGTNRSKFFRGEVDKYTWVDIGSSYLPSDILAAILYEQLNNMDAIKKDRKRIFNFYYDNLRDLEERGVLRLPGIPPDCDPNYHIFYVIMDSEKRRDDILNGLKSRGISATFHYIPLHSAPMGRKLGYEPDDLPVTMNMSGRILRLPLYYGLEEEKLQYVVDQMYSLLE